MNFQITLYTGISIGFLLSAIHAQITLNGEFFTVEAIPIFLGIFGFLVGAAATVLYCLPKVDLKYQEDKSSESTQQKEEK